MECEPTARAAVVKLATPLALRVAEPRVFLPSRKVTEPVGVAALPETVAVRVTGEPRLMLVAETVRFTLGVSSTEVREMEGELLAAFRLSPA